MIISKSEGHIIGFQLMDMETGPEVHVRSYRDMLFPFNQMPMPGDGINLNKYRFKKVRITVELIDND